MSILIYGAGQIGAVVASVLYECGQEIVGFIDDREEALGSKVAGLTVLGNRAWLLKNCGKNQVCNAIGGIQSRKAVAAFLDEAGILTVGAIHPTVIISPEVCIGPDVIVGAGSVLFGHVSIGRGCYIGPSVTVSHNTVVGN
jgi:hypothetical protein